MPSKQSTGISWLPLFLSLFALLVSCGGGSSSGGAPLSSDKAITAFSFTAAANPQLGADLTGTINEADGTILLAGPLEADDVAGLKASFMTTGKEVGVGGVAQESGVTANSFAGPLAYRVTAEDGSTRDYRVCVAYWKHPSGLTDNISPDEQDAWFDFQVAMDNNGNALIVWRQSDGNNWQIFKSEYRDGAWTHPEDLDDNISPDDQDAYEPRAAMDNNGNAIIVWHQYDGSTNLIYKSEYRDGAWSHPEDLTEFISLDGLYAESPQVAMDDSGNAVIAWEQHNGANWQVFKSEYRDGAWTDPAGVSESGSVIVSQVAMDNNGNALIAWTQDVDHHGQIFISEYRGGAWTGPVNISQSEQNTECPRVAMDNNGNALIVWYQPDGSNLKMIFKSEYRDGEWTHPSGLDDNISPDGQDAYVPQVAMDAGGNALIAWDQTVDGGNLQIYKSEYRDGEWTHPEDLDDNITPGGDAYNNQVAMDALGNALIVWEEHDGGHARILKSEYRGGAWTHPADIADGISPEGDPNFPQVAMDALGNALIVWPQYDGSKTQIFKSEYRFWDE